MSGDMKAMVLLSEKELKYLRHLIWMRTDDLTEPDTEQPSFPMSLFEVRALYAKLAGEKVCADEDKV